MIFSGLLALFIVVPLAELFLLLEVADHLGARETIGIVILTGFVGVLLARREGFRVMLAIRRDLEEGQMPAPRMMDGLMILLAGALLITPGLITDTVGFLLLLPFVRAAIRMWLRRKLERKLREGSVQTTVWRW